MSPKGMYMLIDGHNNRVGMPRGGRGILLTKGIVQLGLDVLHTQCNVSRVVRRTHTDKRGSVGNIGDCSSMESM